MNKGTLAERGDSARRENGTRPRGDKKASSGDVKGIEAVTGELIEKARTGSVDNAGRLVLPEHERQLLHQTQAW